MTWASYPARPFAREEPMNDDDLEAWLTEVQRRSLRRAQIVGLTQARGFGRPVALARRARLKVAEVGVRETAALAINRAASKLRGRA